jgi:peptidoglycan/xylan/chitin deacetylase (PgdA/CDA1 family)
MSGNRRTPFLILTLVASGAWFPPGLEAQPLTDSAAGPDRGSRRVAVTFDDVPLSGSPDAACDAAALERLTLRLVDRIVSLDMPATGLVVESRVCDRLRPTLLPRLLAVWLDAGLDLGNHTFSHPDLNRTPVERYRADIVNGEATVGALLEERGTRLRYFRYPLLHAGTSLATKRAVKAFLFERGYAIAPVTIDNQEWVFAAVYARAKGRGDSATVRRISEAYLAHMAEAFLFYERLSTDVLGYELPQVLLLHANEMNADLLGELAALMEVRGYRFVSLDEALADPAYGRLDEYVGPRGLSWLQRWALADGLDVPPEPREPGWVAEMFRTY